MQSAEIPDNEKERLKALCELDILDTPAEERFDRLTRLAKSYFDVPFALVSLVDSARQWFKSRQGLEATQTPRDISFCGHAIHSDATFYIPNALDDARFADNPLVSGAPNIRFYAGAPLKTSDGYRIGTLCIIDTRARELSAQQLAILRDLADLVQEELNQARIRSIKERLDKTSARLEHLLSANPGVIYTCQASGDYGATFVSDNVLQLLGYRPDEFTGHPAFWLEQIHPDDLDRVLAELPRLFEYGHHTHEYRFRHADGSYRWMHDSLNLLRDVNGQPREIVGLLMDITQRKHDEEKVRQSHTLLDMVYKAQSLYIDAGTRAGMFEQLLDDILVFTGSEYGFIGEVLHDADGKPYLKTHGITNIAWDDATRAFYENNAPKGLEFTNLDNLFGHVISRAEVVIANDPLHDPRRSGLPEGHPDLRAFLGIPFFQGGELIGMLGIANRAAGYDQTLVETLQPLLASCANIIESMRREKRRLQAEETTKKYALALERLHAVTADTSLALKDKIQALLDLGRQIFDLPQAIISRVEGERCVVEYSAGVADVPAPGCVFELDDTYCSYTVRSGRPLGFHHAGKSDISKHPGYKKFALECYIGTPLFVNGRFFGSMNFSGREPRERAFNDADFSLIQLFAEWIGHEIASERANAELQESTTRIRAIVDTVVDGIITIDDVGIVQTFNPAAENIFAYSADEVIGKNVSLLMPEPYQSEHDQYLKHYLSGREARVIGIGREVEGRRKDGSTFPLELAVSQMEIDGQRLFTGVVRDITERKKVERMKSEFVSTVSHELRTPLTSIRGALGLVLGKYAHDLPAHTREMLEMAERNSVRLTLLINDILDLEKIESGRLEFEFRPIDVVAVAHAALEVNDGYARQHQVRLELEIADGIDKAVVWGDENRLLQVFANLISNAVKYSPPAGVVKIGIMVSGDGFRISVRDRGRGIPEEFRARIFQRFAQADSSDTREKGGTGLGLSISKAIIERHHGHIDYATELGQGSLFYFDLPHWHEVHEHGGSRSDRPQVLICEDNVDVAKFLASLLQQEGIASDRAATAAATRAMLAKHGYRLLLLDLSLPDADGLDLLRELRQNEATSHLPVIVVSGRAQEGKAAFSGDAVNVVDWLQKPVDRERLDRALQQALQGTLKPKVLHVEDDSDIVQVTAALLEEIADYVHVSTLEQARRQLLKGGVDLVILDLKLADGSGLELLDELQGMCPVVLFSALEPSTEVSQQVTAALTKAKTSNGQLLATVKKLLRHY